ncbi:Os04g0548550 [Oryza sativa Japonica Group]|uniref:Os04g0548550 protein n=1 Tax=Oryza sativa subsp. japonica TaxID=39947 RepID=A0A0P0WD95_ORYSJ|nr:Os04g0548550 [Oryza sativa Japonica Group]
MSRRQAKGVEGSYYCRAGRPKLMATGFGGPQLMAATVVYPSKHHRALGYQIRHFPLTRHPSTVKKRRREPRRRICCGLGEGYEVCCERGGGTLVMVDRRRRCG